jgi:hypothetical protein
MGNRGILHDADGHITRPWVLKRWIVCVLEFGGRKRTVMKPNSYTELFFLDEATALAAGHRPCAECRHSRFLEFGNAWNAADSSVFGSRRATADEIDNRLHAERVNTDRSKRTHPAPLEDLPDGTVVSFSADDHSAWLVFKDAVFKWSPSGYVERQPRPRDLDVLLLTPPSTVAAIRAGYLPEIHASLNLVGAST